VSFVIWWLLHHYNTKNICENVKKVLLFYTVYATIRLSNNKNKKEAKMNPETNSNMLASWNQERSTDQLLGFIARREAAIADLEE